MPYTDAIYIDFSNTFDKVNHNNLLIKLDKIGCDENYLKWIKYYPCCQI